MNWSFCHSDFFISLTQEKNYIMNKNKIIALVILAFLVLVPFQTSYIEFTVESQLLQALTMAITIIGTMVAIFMFNKGESSH
jgi:hypothetical protein